MQHKTHCSQLPQKSQSGRLKSQLSTATTTPCPSRWRLQVPAQHAKPSDAAPSAKLPETPQKPKTPASLTQYEDLSGGSDRRRSGDLSIFSRTLYQLSYRALARYRPDHDGPGRTASATSTGLEPATSAVTGRRANQLRHEASLGTKPDSWTSRLPLARVRTPNGIRTRAAAVKGRCPRPLDDGGLGQLGSFLAWTSISIIAFGA